jgi:hypothetical protein
MHLSLKAYIKNQTFVGVTMRHVIGVILLFASTLANAIPITYTVNRQVGQGSVVGTITTDGTQGALETANILDWNLTLTASSSSILLTGADNSFVFINPNTDPAVFAATEALWFDYSVPASSTPTNPSLHSSMLFGSGAFGSGESTWCLSRDSSCGFTNPVGWEQVSVGFPGVGYDQVYSAHALAPEIFGTAVPITSTAWLLGLGLAGLGWLKRRRLLEIGAAG